MREVEKKKFKSTLGQKINIKMSNMEMKIALNKKIKKTKITNSFLLNKENINSFILPSFTKRIFQSVSKY